MIMIIIRLSRDRSFTSNFIITEQLDVLIHTQRQNDDISTLTLRRIKKLTGCARLYPWCTASQKNDTTASLTT